MLFFKMAYLKPTYTGSNNDSYTIHGPDADVHQDRINGGDGYHYYRTGGGDDGIIVDSNWGTWRGLSNDFNDYTRGDVEYGNSTLVDGGAGNDNITIQGGEGAFHVVTGEGRDSVSVTGMYYQEDFIRINATDGDNLRDTFMFGSGFNGDAQIWGADSFDQLTLKGGDWDMVSNSGGIVVYANDTGGSVSLSGITHTPSYSNLPDVVLL